MPNATMEEIIDLIKDILEHAPRKYPIVIIGDFKLDMFQNNYQQKKTIVIYAR